MHDVRVALHEHQVADADGAVVADAANVIAAQVDEHDVLSALFFVVAQLFFQAAVFGFVTGRACACPQWADTQVCVPVTRTSISGDEPRTVMSSLCSPCMRRKYIYGDGFTRRSAR